MIKKEIFIALIVVLLSFGLVTVAAAGSGSNDPYYDSLIISEYGYTFPQPIADDSLQGATSQATEKTTEELSQNITLSCEDGFDNFYFSSLTYGFPQYIADGSTQVTICQID